MDILLCVYKTEDFGREIYAAYSADGDKCNYLRLIRLIPVIIFGEGWSLMLFGSRRLQEVRRRAERGPEPTEIDLAPDEGRSLSAQSRAILDCRQILWSPVLNQIAAEPESLRTICGRIMCQRCAT